MIALDRTHTTDVTMDADKLSTQWPADGKLGLLRELWILRQVPKNAFETQGHVLRIEVPARLRLILEGVSE